MRLDIENRARLAFALVVLLAAAAAAAWYYTAFGRYTTFEIRTHDAVSGLIADAPVEFHGVEVGRVRSVELTDPRSIRILLSIDRDAPVSRATVATITARGLATRGFMGYVYVALEDAGADSRPLAAAAGEAFPIIPTATARLVSLDTAIGEVNDNVRRLTGLIHTLLDARTLVSLKASADHLERVTATLAANDRRLGSLLVNAERASGQLPPLLQSGTDTARLLETQVLPQAYKTLVKIDQLSTALDGFAGKLERDPSVLLRGSAPPPPGPGEGR